MQLEETRAGEEEGKVRDGEGEGQGNGQNFGVQIRDSVLL